MSEFKRDSVIKPGTFGVGVAADGRRVEFDFKNESLLRAGVRPDAVFIGDSITHVWELQAYFGGTGRVLVNRGIGGDTSVYVRKRFAADVLQLRPSLCVMKIGTNDLGWALEQLDEKLTDSVPANIAAMAADSKQAGIRLALCSILPVWGPSWYPAPEFAIRKNAQIVRVNARLAAVAAAQDAVYVDYHSQMVGADGALPRNLADDGVHPHAAGYAIMADVLRRTLQANGVEL